MEVKSRHYLSAKDVKKFNQEIVKLYPHLEGSVELKNSTVEVITLTENIKLYIVDNKLDWIMIKDRLIPSVSLLNRGLEIPFIKVDMGAIPFIAKGADVMRPGIVDASDKISRGSIVKIIDEKYSKTIAVGESLINYEEFKVKKQGKAVKVLHHVGDKLWSLAGSLNIKQ
ncbi:MAG: DUF1947 domain-containing protein [Candidatus Odinarchaeum yellowstonii]|uniref:DUF1947 domain-containing protein n=1 Tax=Odinarchaeota yellowstonii (strain LCB_4) TaxID=1841599 RepID=A0AAF0D339_ODILC|nr:MAG: DUF1947 domain-containing protein [Candidatus Odinarchaeum yellowstonii]